MAISPVAGAAATQPTVDRAKLLDNYEAFLKLLTTQLRNQSPLEPLDANQFTQQLVQFSTVEQAIKTNDTLERMVDLSLASQATTLVGFIGTDIVAESATTALSAGSANWRFNAAAAGKATVTVRDSAGSLVLTRDADIVAGSNSFAWDGRTSTGSVAPDGLYTISVAASDANGRSISVKSEVSGRVTGVDFSGSEPILKIGNVAVTLASLRSVTSHN